MHTDAELRLRPGRANCPQTAPDPTVHTADTDELVLGFERKRDVLWKSSHSEDKEAEGQETPRDGLRAGCCRHAGAQGGRRGGITNTHSSHRVFGGADLFISFSGGGVMDAEHYTTAP